jgi:hypothetical protein
VIFATVKVPPLFVWCLALLGVVLTVTVIPGVITVDENSYLATVVAFRQGRLTVASTEGLPPSPELLAFDPTPRSRRITTTPFAPSAPPLYAPIALPFAVLGWRGLVFLNTLAYLFTTFLVFVWVARYSRNSTVPWVGAAAFALGGYTIEYAQGLWPQMLSVALCTAGVFLAGRVLEGTRTSAAAAAGFLLAVAAGVRYQNAAILALVGAALLMWSPRRWSAVPAFAAGAAIPLSASSLMNHLRLGSWNPISKGEGYLPLQVVREPASTIPDAFVMLWARVVDFTARPPLTGPAVEHWLTYEPQTGTHIVIGYVLKKALLQSAPWAVLGLAVMAAVWWPRFAARNPRTRQLRLLSIVTAGVLGVFALAGPRRHDGIAFNERYLLELLPFLAVAFAWSLDDLNLHERPLEWRILGGAACALLVFTLTWGWAQPEDPRWLVRQYLHLRFAGLLATSLCIVWLVERLRRRGASVLSVMVGVSLVWGLLQHGTADLYGSRRTRIFHASRTDALASFLPDRAAIVAFYWQKEAVLPLTLTKDVVVVNPWVDGGRDTPLLVTELLRSGRRVFLLTGAFPETSLHRALLGRTVTPTLCCVGPFLQLVELR